MEKIDVNEIRIGDKIRVEFAGGEHTAVEYPARFTGDWGVPKDWNLGRGTYYLLERPVVVPTLPYSLLIPPKGERDGASAYVLEPFYGKLKWVDSSGFVVTEERVKERLAEGWVGVEGREDV